MHVTPFDMSRLFSWFWGIVMGAMRPAFDAIQVNAIAAAAGISEDMLKVALGIYGIMLMLGLAQAPVSNLVSLGLRGAVLATVLTASFYNYWVRDLVTSALPQLWGQISSFGTAGGLGPAAPFDALFNQANAAGWDVYRRLPEWTFLKLFVFAYFGVALVAIGCGFMIWAEGAFCAALYVAIGPIILPLVLFKATRPIFTAWVGITASAALLQLLALTVASVLVLAMRGMLAAITSGIFGDATAVVAALMASALIFFLCARWSLKMPAVAAQLCGGVHWHPAPLVSAAYGAIMSAFTAPVTLPLQAAKMGAGAALGGVAGIAATQAGKLLSGPSNPPGPSLSRSRAPASSQGKSS